MRYQRSAHYWSSARGTAPAADELDSQSQLIVDGTLLPCWSWASAPGLYSGKHKTTGMNVQVACTLEGEIAWISDPVEGSRHGMYCIGESEVLSGIAPVEDHAHRLQETLRTSPTTISIVVGLYFTE